MDVNITSVKDSLNVEKTNGLENFLNDTWL